MKGKISKALAVVGLALLLGAWIGVVIFLELLRITVGQ